VDRLKRWRQPAAFVVLGALVARLVLSIAGLFVFAAPENLGSFPLAAFSVAPLVLDGTGLVVLALLVVACATGEPTSHARFLTGAACVVAVASVGLALAFVAIGGTVTGSNSVINVLALLVALVPPAVVSAGLALLWRHQTGEVSPIAAHRPPTLPEQTATPQAAVAGAPEVGPHSAPTWQPHEAAGAVWTTAGAAAAGGAAAGWGSPDSGAGWNPLPGAPRAGELPAGPEWSPPPPAGPSWSPAPPAGPNWEPAPPAGPNWSPAPPTARPLERPQGWAPPEAAPPSSRSGTPPGN